MTDNPKPNPVMKRHCFTGICVDGPILGQTVTHVRTVIDGVISEQNKRVRYEYREFSCEGVPVAGFWTCEGKTHDQIMTRLIDLAYAPIDSPRGR